MSNITFSAGQSSEDVKKIMQVGNEAVQVTTDVMTCSFKMFEPEEKRVTCPMSYFIAKLITIANILK